MNSGTATTKAPRLLLPTRATSMSTTSSDNSNSNNNNNKTNLRSEPQLKRDWAQQPRRLATARSDDQRRPRAHPRATTTTTTTYTYTYTCTYTTYKS